MQLAVRGVLFIESIGEARLLIPLGASHNLFITILLIKAYMCTRKSGKIDVPDGGTIDN